MASKSSIRKRILLERKEIFSPRNDEKISQHLLGLLNDKIKNIHVYLPMEDEIDITFFIEAAIQLNKNIYSSVSLKGGQLKHRNFTRFDKLEEGIFGTRHPIGPDLEELSLDMIIVPGLAYDRRGYRVGYGGGYYDRFLSKHPHTLYVAPCYDFQIMTEVPREDFDIPIHLLATPDKIIRTNSSANATMLSLF